MSDKPDQDPNVEKVQPFDVFVSYARKDTEVAERLVESLERRRVRCWLDRGWDQRVEKWADEIRDVIDRSRTFVVVVSRATLPSNPRLSMEWSEIQKRAWRRQNVSIFPIRVGNVEVPLFLCQWPSFQMDTPKASVQGITEAIRAHLTGGSEQKKHSKTKGSDRAMTVERFREIERALATSRDDEVVSSSNE
jgi:hypothetical protein